MNSLVSIFTHYQLCLRLTGFSLVMLCSINAEAYNNNNLLQQRDAAGVAPAGDASLTNFVATPELQYVRLDWTMTSESNIDYYVIEKSQDGANFEFVEKVDKSNTAKYQTVDYYPLDGLSYYRLKLCSFGGKSVYSKTTAIKMSVSKDFSFYIYPNPTTGGNLTLKFKNISSGTVQVKFINLVGNELVSQNIPVPDSGDFTTTIDLPNNLPAGTYLVKVDSKNITCTKRCLIRK